MGPWIIEMKLFYKKGMTIIEVVISIGIFSVLSTVGYQVYITAHGISERTRLASQAVWFAEEGIEATRSIRDKDFSLLSAGTKGLALVSNAWAFSGTSDTNGIFSRSLAISTLSADSRQVTSTITWPYKGTTNTSVLTTVLTNWHKSINMASALSVNTSSANLSLADSRRLLNGITLTSDGTTGTVSIVQITATWTTAARRLQEVRSPNGVIIFGPASLTSGSTATLTSPIVISGAANTSFQLRFNGNMNNNTIGITFIMSDGSTESVSIVNPPTGT